MAFNVLIDENPFKNILYNIHLISFRAFLPKFMVFGRGFISEVYL